MKVDRDVMARHLGRIACNGRIQGAVFSGSFRTAALSEDHLLMVLAPELEGGAALAEDLGIPSLSVLLNALKVVGSGTGGAEVEMRVSDHRLVIDEGGRGVLRLITAAPRTISSYVPVEIVQALEAKAPGADSAPTIALTPQLLAAVRDTFTLFKADEVEVTLGPTGGTIRVGNEKSNVADFPFDAQADDEYTLLFGEHLVDVLRTVSDDGTARLILGAPDAPSCVEDGAYRYLLGPTRRAADD